MFKSEGLTLPDCHCFKTKANIMNKTIDTVSSIVVAAILEEAVIISLCNEAKEYWLSCFIGDILMCALKFKDNNNPDINDIVLQEKEFEAVYERIKPLVMQRLEYTCGRLEKVARN